MSLDTRSVFPLHHSSNTWTCFLGFMIWKSFPQFPRLCLALRQISLVFEVNKALYNLQSLRSSISLHSTERFKVLDPALIALPDIHMWALFCILCLWPLPSHQPPSTIQSLLFALAWPISPSESRHLLYFLPSPLQRSSFPNISGNFIICKYLNSYNRETLQMEIRKS